MADLRWRCQHCWADAEDNLTEGLTTSGWASRIRADEPRPGQESLDIAA